MVTINTGAKGYRLPTETEWEYAAGVGTGLDPSGNANRTQYAGTNNESELYKYSNYCDVNCTYSWKDSLRNDGFVNTAPVGSFLPNQLGLYDMSGNVWEWCFDWYDTYASGAQTNPMGAAKGSNRVFRGGSWRSIADDCRVAYRFYNYPGNSNFNLGFRVVLIP